MNRSWKDFKFFSVRELNIPIYWRTIIEEAESIEQTGEAILEWLKEVGASGETEPISMV